MNTMYIFPFSKHIFHKLISDREEYSRFFTNDDSSQRLLDLSHGPVDGAFDTVWNTALSSIGFPPVGFLLETFGCSFSSANVCSSGGHVAAQAAKWTSTAYLC